jgi:hypothetical protein
MRRDGCIESANTEVHLAPKPSCMAGFTLHHAEWWQPFFPACLKCNLLTQMVRLP